MDEEDKKLFESAMHGVEKLDKTKSKYHFRAKKSYQKVQRNHDFDENNHSFEINEYETISQDTILSYKYSGVANTRFNQLKKGLIPYRAKLDLHALTSGEAIIKLDSFINESNVNCILVIHGKGTGVIKSVTNQLLKIHPKVMAFHSALNKDGGSGSVYVLLKSIT